MTSIVLNEQDHKNATLNFRKAVKESEYLNSYIIPVTIKQI